MKIVAVNPWVDYRGAESVMVNLSYHLSKAGNHTDILTVYVDDKYPPSYYQKIKIHTSGRFISAISQKSLLLYSFLGMPTMLLKLIWLIRRYDLVLCFNPPSLILSFIPARLFGKKIFWFCQSLPYITGWKSKKSFLEYIASVINNSYLDRLVVSKVDGIITVSELTKRQLEKKYAATVHIVRPGYPKPKGRASDLPVSIKKMRLENNLLLLQVGNLHWQKRQALSIKALSRLIQSGISAGLIIVGVGSDRKKLEKLGKKYRVDNHVAFMGFVPPRKLKGYYQTADLNLLPSVNESFSATPLEALSAGTPSVISNSSGVGEIIRDYALVCRPNTASLFNKIIEYNRNKSFFNAKAKNGGRYISRNLSWNRSANALMKVINGS